MKIPPNGFIGTGSQSVAVQQLVSKAMGKKPRRKVRRKKVAKKRPVRRRRVARKRTTRKKKPAYMVKGSAAAKRRMAQLRRMRKR